MTTTSNATLVLGRGELYFDRFVSGTMRGEGERYFGNTLDFTVSRSVEEVERFTSYGGQQIKIDSLITREVYAADITTDNISMENVALWFGAEPNTGGQVAIGTISETIVVRRGRWYQLGTSVEPFGVRHIEPDISFSVDGNMLSREGNLYLDRVEGRFFVTEDAADLNDGDSLVVSFQWRESSSVDVSEATKEVVGALRFISKNVVGPQISYFFPYVCLTPASNLDLKADSWQEFSFDVDVRRLSPLRQFVYVKQFSGPLLTEDEQAIIDLGPMSLDDFPYWEDQLHQILNTSMPAADFGQVITYP